MYIKEREESHAQNAYNINKGRLFVLKTEDLLDSVIDILDDDCDKHKKELHQYVPQQVQTGDEIERENQLVADEFA